jgi:hemolysin III
LAFLRKLDHTAIYLLIAGSYTPICYIRLAGFWKWGMLVLIWSLAFIGIGVKIFVIKAPRWITAGVYVVMGWLSLLAVRQIVAALPPGALVGLAAGGIIYTLGAVVYIIKKPDFVPGVFGFHELWHLFVILAALAHFIAIAGYVAPAAIMGT